jgi:hypothetical protein
MLSAPMEARPYHKQNSCRSLRGPDPDKRPISEKVSEPRLRRIS